VSSDRPNSENALISEMAGMSLQASADYALPVTDFLAIKLDILSAPLHARASHSQLLDYVFERTHLHRSHSNNESGDPQAFLFLVVMALQSLEIW